MDGVTGANLCMAEVVGVSGLFAVGFVDVSLLPCATDVTSSSPPDSSFPSVCDYSETKKYVYHMYPSVQP